MHRLRFNIVPFLLVFSLLLFTLVYTGAASIYNTTALLFVLSCSYVVGQTLIPRKLDEVLLPVTQSLVSVLVGALPLSLLIFLSVNVSLLLAVYGLLSLAVLLWQRKRISIGFNFDAFSVVAFALAFGFMLLISNWEIFSQFSAEQIGTLNYTDPYFFTAITASFRNGTLRNAVYETGSPIIYQDIGFFIPGMFAAILKVTSHQALWGLVQPLYKLTVLLLGYDFYRWFFRDGKDNKYLFLLAAIALPLLLAPLHPLYVARLNVHNFIFSGMGHLLPVGTVTYPVSIILTILSILAFSICDWRSKGQYALKIFFALAFGLIIIAKTPMYIALLFFFCPILLYRIVVKKERLFGYLPYAVLSLFIAAVAYKICFGFPVLSKLGFRYGYLAEFFGALYHKSTVGVKNNIIVLGLILATFILWLGIRLVGLAGLIKARRQVYSEFFMGAVFSLLATTTFALFIRLTAVNVHGKELGDVSFDAQQFIRSSFYIATLISGIGILYLVFYLPRKIARYTFAAVTTGWCLLAFCTIASRPLPEVKSVPWYSENLAALKSGKLSDGLIVVNPAVHTYGLMLSSSDYGRYWSAMGQGEQCYNAYVTNAYRWEMFADMLVKPTDSLFDAFKKEDVKYVIATPVDVERLTKLSGEFPSRLKKLDSSNWVFELL